MNVGFLADNFETAADNGVIKVSNPSFEDKVLRECADRNATGKDQLSMAKAFGQCLAQTDHLGSPAEVEACIDVLSGTKASDKSAATQTKRARVSTMCFGD